MAMAHLGTTAGLFLECVLVFTPLVGKVSAVSEVGNQGFHVVHNKITASGDHCVHNICIQIEELIYFIKPQKGPPSNVAQ